MGHWFGRLLGLVLAGLLVACGSGSSQDTELRGQILDWRGSSSPGLTLRLKDLKH